MHNVLSALLPDFAFVFMCKSLPLPYLLLLLLLSPFLNLPCPLVLFVTPLHPQIISLKPSLSAFPYTSKMELYYSAQLETTYQECPCGWQSAWVVTAPHCGSMISFGQGISSPLRAFYLTLSLLASLQRFCLWCFQSEMRNCAESWSHIFRPWRAWPKTVKVFCSLFLKYAWLKQRISTNYVNLICSSFCYMSLLRNYCEKSLVLLWTF